MTQSLEEKLEEKFHRSTTEYRGPRRNAFLWQGGRDKQGTRYGSFKTVYEDELVQREYLLYEADYEPAIEYTDVWFDPKTNKYIRKEDYDKAIL